LLASVVYSSSQQTTQQPVISWHKDIAAALSSNQWDTVRTTIAQLNQHHNQNSHNNSHNFSFTSNSSADYSDTKQSKAKSFWSRISNLSRNSNSNTSTTSSDKTGLLVTDHEHRTPLHLLLSSRRTTPVDDVLLPVLALEPRAAATPNHRGRLPLHFAVVHRFRIAVIAALIDAYPAAISFPDCKGQSPLQYAVDIAKRESSNNKGGSTPPRTYWMPLPQDCEEAIWQEEQAERWGVVHWLLLSSATHPQTSLSVGGSKPMLVEALLNAASPTVISLLIGASVMLLSYENKATAFAGSTLYTCISRHYPLTILMSLASQCPNDVHKVRDETGMGLVSAQFISACFEQISSTQEWTVSEDFYACMLECMQEGEIGDDPALLDWWRKIEFLIAFCACSTLNRRIRIDGKKYEPSCFPKEYLLHAALLNVDTPPSVIRMLLALYPESIRLKDPSTGALPLHMAAMKRDYVPRNYEVHTTGSESVMEIILEADRSAVNKRHNGRLPLHYAVASGRMIGSLNPLLAAATAIHKTKNDDDEYEHTQLLQRDPRTGLFPFLQAASYPNKSDEDSFRWTCVARNKYSNAVWRGLSDRRKASAVLKVAEVEDIARIDTIYELLRRQPGVICDKRQPQRRSVKGKSCSNESVSLARDSTGRGVVAAHYISWCFIERFDEVRGSSWEPNANHQVMLRYAVHLASTTGSFSLLPSDFDAWWTKMMFYIRNGCRRNITPCPPPHDNFESLAIPLDKDEFLLHAALANSDSPPELVEILLATNIEAASLFVPGSSLLPLHIAALTPSYIPRSFERYQHSSLDLTLKAYPRAARVMSNGQLPLHMAVAAGKSCHDIESLVSAEPRALGVKDRSTGLYPFQLMASRQEYTAEQRLQFQYLARNRFEEKAWNYLTPQARTKQVQHVQKEHELDLLSSIFSLLRRDPALLKRPQLESDDKSDSQSAITGYLSANISLQTPSFATKKSDVSATEGDDSTFFEQSKEMVSPAVRMTNTSSLMLLLSQHRSTRGDKNDDVFQCDASVFSNVDVMSTLTSTIHSAEKNEKTVSNDFADEESINIYSFGGEQESVEETSYDDFAEDSYVRGSSTQNSDCNDDFGSAAALETTDNSEVEESNLHSDDESAVTFEIRRLPRFSSGKTRDSDAAPASVKLSKMPPQSLLAEIKAHSLSSRETSLIKTHSLSSRETSVKLVSERTVSSSVIDNNSQPSRFSYKSLLPEEIARMNASADMLWMSPDLLNTEISGRDNECSVDNEHSSVSLSLTSNHRHDESVASQSTKSSAQRSIQKGSNTTNVVEKATRSSTLNPSSASSEASSSRSDARGMAKTSRSSNSRGRSFGKSLSFTAANQTSQASLLGNYNDCDTIEDDPLLNIDLEPPRSNGLRSISEHSTKLGRASPENDLLPYTNAAHGSKQENAGRYRRRSASDRTAKTSRSSLSVGLDSGSRSSIDDAILLNSDPIATKLPAETSRGTTFMGSINLIDGSQFKESSVIVPGDEMKSKEASAFEGFRIKDVGTCSSRVEHSSSNVDRSSTKGRSDEGCRLNDGISSPRTIRYEVESSNQANFSQPIRDQRGGDESANPAKPACHFSTAVSSEAVVVPVSSKYFDKASMMWKERPNEQERINHASLNGGAETLKSHAANLKPAMCFDKQSMRWVESSEQSQVELVRELSEAKRIMASTPFVALLSSKAAQISKSERHQAATNGRTQFRGRSPMNRAPSVRETHGQLVTMFTSSQNRLTCLLCKGNEREVLMIPCRHLCICRRCSLQQRSIPNCPLCAGRVTGIMLLF
jgi:Zinc finger, C3HC4 type (RING finger)